MTADFYLFDMKFIGQVATCIVKGVKGVNRMVSIPSRLDREA